MKVATMQKRNSVVTVQLVEGRLVFNVLGAGSVAFDPSKAHEANQRQAAMHGWKQRLSDAAALSRDDNNIPASPVDKLEAIRALAAHYESGAAEWSRAGSGGGGSSLTIEAIARVKSTDYATAEGFVADYAKAKHGGDTKAALAFLRDGKRVQEAMAAIRAERQPAPKIDADEALGELGEEVQ